MTFLDIENASRDELVALAKAQHETIASMAKQQAVHDQLVEALEKVDALWTPDFGGPENTNPAVHDTEWIQVWVSVRNALAAAKEGA